MSSPETASQLSDWQAQATQYLLKADYLQAAHLYEQAIAVAPEVRSHYWQLGLCLLLQGQEAEAQTTWLMAMAEGDPEEINQWVAELSQILQTEADRQEALADYQVAWAIRQHLREICPDEINNLLQLINYEITLGNFSPERLAELNLIALLQAQQSPVDCTLLLAVMARSLRTDWLHPLLLEWVEASLAYIDDPQTLMPILLAASIHIGYTRHHPGFAAELIELYLRLDPDNREFLGHLASFYQNSKQYDRGIAVAQRCCDLPQPLVEHVFSNYLLLRGLLNAGGYWTEAVAAFEQQESLLQALVAESPLDLHPVHVSRLVTTSFFFPYLRDDLKRQRDLQNQVLQLYQANVQTYAAAQIARYQHPCSSQLQRQSKRLKIGYLSHCMSRHSVGWLARWLVQHHDRDRMSLYGYFINYQGGTNDLQEWYVSQMEYAHKFGIEGSNSAFKIADQIYQDEIDILIDLDSLTLDLSCDVLALKPAPVQVTWLGWDAPGLPAIDYFIADPYVLPDWAQAHYTEKIWRLPQTYIAVDGFEVGVPTLRRDQLGVPADAIVYISAQRGYKRHRDTAKLQMQIIQAVPNSYFFIKGFADEDSIQKFFFDLAEEVGVAPGRLRFLPDALSESVHRANLAIADIVLDTYPYNGATTTLETLWMGIPIVTRVGEQFAARNSYTMMTNAGITEGIAWSNQEYVNWGIRLGQDPALRQHIAWKLHQSRHTAPLWNAKQFTRDMENAYEQMWQLYCDSINTEKASTGSA